MKLGVWMLAGSVVSALGITAYLGRAASLDVRLGLWLGMLGPLAATLVSAEMVERVYRRHPERLTGVMIVAFAAKMFFFGGYVLLIVKAGWVQPGPFAISFTSYFLALHIIEAFRLKRLFAGI